MSLPKSSVELQPFSDCPALDGCHCVTNSLAKIFHHAGRPLSEEMLLGLGAGIGFIYWQMKFGGETSVFVGGRTNLKNFSQDIARRTGVRIAEMRTRSTKKAEDVLLGFLERQQPAMLGADMGFLPWFDFSGGLSLRWPHVCRLRLRRTRDSAWVGHGGEDRGRQEGLLCADQPRAAAQGTRVDVQAVPAKESVVRVRFRAFSRAAGQDNRRGHCADCRCAAPSADQELRRERHAPHRCSIAQVAFAVQRLRAAHESLQSLHLHRDWRHWWRGLPCNVCTVPR